MYCVYTVHSRGLLAVSLVSALLKSVCYAGWLPLCGDEGGGQQGPQGAGEQPQCPQQSHQPLLSTANQDQARTHNSIVWLVWEQGTGINNNSIIHRNVRVILK